MPTSHERCLLTDCHNLALYIINTSNFTNNCKENLDASWGNNCANAKTKAQISFAVSSKLISAFVFAAGIVQFFTCLNPNLQLLAIYCGCTDSVICVGHGNIPHCLFSHDAAQIIFEDHRLLFHTNYCQIINS